MRRGERTGGFERMRRSYASGVRGYAYPVAKGGGLPTRAQIRATKENWPGESARCYRWQDPWREGGKWPGQRRQSGLKSGGSWIRVKKF